MKVKIKMLKQILDNQKNSQAYKDYQDIVDALSYYRDNIQPMTDEQGNNFRHIAGSALMAQKYGLIKSNLYGLGKEAEDTFVKHKGLADGVGDIKNNLYGSLIGAGVKSMPQNTLIQKIFEGYIK